MGREQMMNDQIMEQLEANTNISFTEDVAARFSGYGWNVLRVGDANALDRP